MGGIFKRLSQALRRVFGVFTRTGGGGYLCDDCRWDYGDACRRPERPNARRCPEYKRR